MIPSNFMAFNLIEGAIYKTKINLIALEWGKDNTKIKNKRILVAGSNVFYDHKFNNQDFKDICLFGCFQPHIKHYVIIPENLLENEIELVDDKNLVPLKNKK